MADIVVKRFTASLRGKIFQTWRFTRIFDSAKRLSRVEYCANLLSGGYSWTFATISAHLCRASFAPPCRLLGVYLPRGSMLGAAVHDLGCVKTPKSNLRVEISSRFRQFVNQQR
jgi:hypothetical protein